MQAYLSFIVGFSAMTSLGILDHYFSSIVGQVLSCYMEKFPFLTFGSLYCAAHTTRHTNFVVFLRSRDVVVYCVESLPHSTCMGKILPWIEKNFAFDSDHLYLVDPDTMPPSHEIRKKNIERKGPDSLRNTTNIRQSLQSQKLNYQAV
jgi:hypothetical protein